MAADGKSAQAATLKDRLAAPFREFGRLAGSLYLVDRALRAVSPQGLGLYVYELMVQPITGKPLLPERMAARLRWEMFGPDHPEVARMPARADIKAARFAQDASCLGVYRGDTLLGYLWFCFGRYEEDEVRCDFELSPPAQSVFDFDLYVMPEHRMGIGFVAIWHVANQYLHERGVRYTYSRLTRFNLSSRRAHRHLGWARTAGAVILKLWRWELMVTTCSPWIGLSVFPRQRLRVRLNPAVLTAPRDASA